MESRKVSVDLSSLTHRLNSRQNAFKTAIIEKSHSTIHSSNKITGASVSSEATSTKFIIEQNVPSDSTKKGPYSVKRSVDPNEVVIKRRFGEGSKPLFSRDDINVNKLDDRQLKPQNESIVKKKVYRSQRDSSSSSSSSSSSDEYFDKRRTSNLCKHQILKEPSQLEKTKDKEKVPYFIDQKREIERIQRIKEIRKAETIRTVTSTKPGHSHSCDRIRNKIDSSTFLPTSTKHRTRSRSYSFSPHRSSYRSSSSHKLRHRERITRRRSTSYDRRRRHGQNGSSYYDRHRRRSRSTESRSRSRDTCRRDRSEINQMPLALPQCIPVPVPVPDFPYGYAPWPPQPAWPTVPPPMRFGGYPFRYFLAPVRRPPRPPSSVPYFRQHHYPLRGNFQHRARSNFKPRNSNY